MDMSLTVTPKSDQTNADDLIAGPRTITITRVNANEGNVEQPVNVYFDGDNGKPFRPCKSMRRVMIAVWGVDTKDYVGRSMTIYRDPEVTWGGMKVGGIRISHMSHMDGEQVLALTATKSSRKPFKVRPLKVAANPKPEPRHDPETGEVDAPDDPTDWNAWSKSMAARIDACETVEALAELQTDNNGLIAELGSAKPKLAEKLNMRFGDRMRAIGGEE